VVSTTGNCKKKIPIFEFQIPNEKKEFKYCNNFLARNFNYGKQIQLKEKFQIPTGKLEFGILKFVC